MVDWSLVCLSVCLFVASSSFDKFPLRNSRDPTLLASRRSRHLERNVTQEVGLDGKGGRGQEEKIRKELRSKIESDPHRVARQVNGIIFGPYQRSLIESAALASD